MTSLPSARSSPRIINGVLKWYEGDTFTLDIELELTDQDGMTIDTTGKEVDFLFYNRSNELVKEFIFKNIQNNTVTLVFNTDVSALFPMGEYHYDVHYISSDRTTIVRNNDVIVE